ncbi:MAG: ECF transporter S component [Parasporobacterium sp.]|nr:ECF transporter S component [Parasporobacterium sp.]
MKKTAVMDLCMCAAAAALHIVLELFCTIRIGNDLKITLAALPFIVIAFLCGPLEGFITGIVGTLLSQLLTYGITITTPFWIIPYAVQGLTAGLVFRGFKRKVTVLNMAVSVFSSGFASVVLMWIASYLDGVVFFKYWTPEILIALIPVRLLVWVIISAAYTGISIPLCRALLKSCPAGQKK